ncbi:MAG: ABC transporter permease [Acidobacteriota bacterium]|nr:ABC transporter permease [Acidobacteriota bacterium]
MWNDLRIRLRSIVRRRRVEAELDDELQFHLDRQVEQYLARGLAPDEAARRARVALGGLDQVKEECRDARGIRPLDDLAQDLRFGLRVLRKSPGFTLIAVVTLALGICATSTILSWIDSTLLDPIPGAADTSDLVTVMRGTITEHPSPPFSYPDYVDLRNRTTTLSGLLAYHDDFVSLTGVGKPERIYGALTTANYFDLLGVKPILGRGFTPGEESTPGGAPVVVLSYAFWQSHFGASPSAVGRSVRINRHTYTVIGVAPPGFQGCKTGLRDDVWMPLSMDRDVWGGNRIDDRGVFWLNVLGRLKPGVRAARAAGELNLLMQRIAASTPEIERGPDQITLDPLWRSPFGANVYLYKTLPLLLGLAAVLLLLACANVANLLLMRSVGRRREMALRLAMGASRSRIVRQLLAESLLVALAGGAAAIAITWWTAGAFGRFFPPTGLPLTLTGHMKGSVLVATVVTALLAAVVSGVLPALRLSNMAPVTVLKEEGRTSGGLRQSRVSRVLVVAQIALCLLLLIAAGLFAKSFRNEQRANPGFDPQHVLLASYDLSPTGESAAQQVTFDQRLLDRLRALPGVQSAALADFSPLNFTLHSNDVLPEGYVPQRHESMEIDRATVSPGYFQTLKTPLVAGREFTDHDDQASQPVAIVNQAFGDRYWPGLDPMGRRVTVFGRTFTVVGVVRNAKYRLLHYAPAPIVFLPLYQNPRDQVIVHLRVAGDPGAVAPLLTRTVEALDPDLPVYDVVTLERSMQFGSIFERLAATLVGAFGLLALGLAAVGLYGVVAFATRQRTREIGIRMALGAQRRDVFGLVIGQGLRMALIGVALGLVGALGLTRFISSLLYGAQPTDPLTFIGVSVVLIVVVILACYTPARRASNVDPMKALRYE